MQPYTIGTKYRRDAGTIRVLGQADVILAGSHASSNRLPVFFGGGWFFSSSFFDRRRRHRHPLHPFIPTVRGGLVYRFVAVFLPSGLLENAVVLAVRRILWLHVLQRTKASTRRR